MTDQTNQIPQQAPQDTTAQATTPNILQRISQAKQAGFSDSDIYSTLSSDAGFQKRINMAKKEGFTDEQIAGQLGLKVENSQGKHLASDGYGDVEVELTGDQPETKDLGTQPTMTFKAEEPGFLADYGERAAKYVEGAMQGVHWLGDKTQGFLNKHFGTNFDANEYQKYTKEKQAEHEAFNRARNASEAGFNWGGLAADLITTAPAAILTGGGSTLTQIAARGALGGAAIGGAQFAENADQRLGNTVMGAAGGAIGGAGAKFAGDNIVRGVNALRGNLKAGAQDILDEGAKNNVRVSANDVGQGAIGKKTETLMESIPVVGMAGFREAQQKEAKVAANNITDALRQKMNDIDYKSLDKIQDAAKNGNKNAIRIMSIVNSTGDDTGRVLQAAAEIKNWRGQRIASQMYDQASHLAGDAPVSPSKTIQTIDGVLDADSKVVPNKDLVSELNGIKSKLTDPNINVNFSEMRAARSRLGELVDEWGKQGKSTSGLTQIRTAIDDDLSDFSKNSGKDGLYEVYKRADAFYKQLQNGKDKALANSMRSQTPDEIYGQFMKVGKGDRAENFYKNLDPKGKAALRYEMANTALSKATNESTGVFSPAKFALEFERMHEPYSKVFNGADKAQMDGFVKLMRHVERAGQYAENPPTGNRLMGLAMGGAAATNLPLAAKAAAASAIAKVLFTTNAGKQILLASKDLPPNSPKLANLMRMAEKLSMLAGANATQ